MCLCFASSLVPTSHAPWCEHSDESCGGGGVDGNHHCPHRGGAQVWGGGGGGVMGLISGVLICQGVPLKWSPKFIIN